MKEPLISSESSQKEVVEPTTTAEVECASLGPVLRQQPLMSSSPRLERREARHLARRKLLRSATLWAYYLSAGFLLGLGLPGVLYTLVTENAGGHRFLLPTAAVFVSCAIPVALWGIGSHVANYWQPTLQKYVIRMLWMVPVYSITSLTELWLWVRVENGAQSGLDRWCVVPRALRDCYESYTILNFLYFCLAFLEMTTGESAAAVVARLADDDDEEGPTRKAVPHPCPPYTCFCSPWRLESGEFLKKCQYGVVLYATLMPLCALGSIVDAFFETPDESEDTDMSASAVKALCTPANILYAIQFFASNHAIYCLGLFYYVTHKLLAPSKPHLKFVAVKGIVFGTFFQDMGIYLVFLVKPGLARAFVGDDASDKAKEAALSSVQATLMCCEMLIFAVLHARAFPTSQFPRVSLEDDHSTDVPIAPGSRAWLAAWGDYFDEQKRDRRRWRLSGRRGERPRGTVSASRLIFDVADVHADTAATFRNLPGDVTEPILYNSSSSLLTRSLRRWRNIDASVTFARLAARTTGAAPFV